PDFLYLNSSGIKVICLFWYKNLISASFKHINSFNLSILLKRFSISSQSTLFSSKSGALSVFTMFKILFLIVLNLSLSFFEYNFDTKNAQTSKPLISSSDKEIKKGVFKT